MSGLAKDLFADGRRFVLLTGKSELLLPTLGPVDHLIADPPYSRRVHENAQTSRRKDLPDQEEYDCRKKRRVAFGFGHLTPALRRAICAFSADNVRRWTLIFSDWEGAAWWRISMLAAGLNYRRMMEWNRENSAPQFNGMEPAPASECILAAHRKGKRRWNGGGKAGRYSFPIVQNRGGLSPRLNDAQKPEGLMEALVRDFTDPGDLVVDATAGSGTTGVACLKLGRRFLGIEEDPAMAERARERLARVKAVQADLFETPAQMRKRVAKIKASQTSLVPEPADGS